jgi:hypothetical protein
LQVEFNGLQHPETIALQLRKHCGVDEGQPFLERNHETPDLHCPGRRLLSACVVLPVGHGHGYGHRHYSAPPVVVVPPAPGPGYRRGYRGW